MRLAGKRAIVTGAGSGFGEGIARRFVAEGAKVAIADINEAAANVSPQSLAKLPCSSRPMSPTIAPSGP
tara:strand:- start:12536 stop:12742 length:207 start_codon:yes stop_codon:yes gene_type:complete